MTNCLVTLIITSHVITSATGPCSFVSTRSISSSGIIILHCCLPLRPILMRPWCPLHGRIGNWRRWCASSCRIPHRLFTNSLGWASIRNHTLHHTWYRTLRSQLQLATYILPHFVWQKMHTTLGRFSFTNITRYSEVRDALNRNIKW